MNDQPTNPQPESLASPRIFEHPHFNRAEWYEEISSTSDTIRDWLHHDPTQRYLCVADRQSKGRGRGDHRWWSPTGCLMFSMSYPIPIQQPLRDIGSISLHIGLAVANQLQLWTQTKLKWPNDLLIENKKVGGILIETSRHHLLIGIGINVDVPLHSAPTDIQTHATSLHLHAPNFPSRQDLLLSLLLQIDQTLAKPWTPDESLPARWSRFCALQGHPVEVQTEQSTHRGTCLGIDHLGHLRLRDPQGLETTFASLASVKRLDAPPTT